MFFNETEGDEINQFISLWAFLALVLTPQLVETSILIHVFLVSM